MNSFFSAKSFSAPTGPSLGGTPGIGQIGNPDGNIIKRPSVRVVLATQNTSGASLTTGTVTARIKNPSSRLVCSFSASFEPAVDVPISNYNSTWTKTAYRPGERRAKLHTIGTAGDQLPTMYEVAGGIREIEVACALGLTTPTVAGQWVMTVEWEPDQLICDEELAELYGGCSAALASGTALTLAP